MLDGDGRERDRGSRARPRVQERAAGGRRDRPQRRARRDLRLPRAERGREVHDRARPDHAAAAHRGDGAGRRLRRREGRAEDPGADRRRAAGGGARPAPHRARPPPPAGDAAERPEGAARVPCGGAAPPGGPHGRLRSQGPGLLGRDEAAPRSRARARPHAAHPLPRRADDRASTRRAARTSGTRSRSCGARRA